nr:hypothetical protein [Desulfobacterales bacterium]
VTVFEMGSGIYLGGSGDGKSGTSNEFEVASQGTNTGFLGGVIEDTQGNRLDGAGIYLALEKEGGVEYTTVTASGIYAFNNIECGKDYIWASYEGTSSRKKEINIPCDRCVTEDLIITLSEPDGKIPILLVPGIMGSTYKTFDGTLPVLPRWSPKTDELELFNKPLTGKKVGWDALKDSLNTLGYEENSTLFDIPYDWRMNLDDAVNNYLKPMIDKAKIAAETSRVNIISHSMGGLLVRAYIQSDGYENDIEKFAMVGTPNHGACNSYYLWEGGDPFRAGFDYSIVLEANYSFYYLRPALKSIEFFWFVRHHNKSVKQLLPTYSFLIPHGELQCEPNDWLVDLNNSISLFRLGQENEEGKVKTKVFMGNNIDTLTRIRVGFKNCWKPVYKDGTPLIAGQETPDGDGTVLSSSAFIGDDVSYAAPVTENHMQLIGSFKDEIISFLTGSAASSSLIKSSTQSTPDEAYLMVNIKGRVQPYIVDPQGKGGGINPDTGSREDAIPGIEINVGTYASTLAIKSPENGVYTISLKGNYNEDYLLNIGYAGSENSYNLDYFGFNHTGTSSFSFTFDSSSGEQIIVNHTPVPRPTFWQFR